MLKFKLIFSSFLIFLLALFLTQQIAWAVCENISCDKNADNYIGCNESQQSCYQKAILEAQSKANTLSNTIGILNSQINVLTLQINQTLAEINNLEKEIVNLGARIEGLSMSLDKLTDVLIKRVSADYKRTRSNPFLLIFSKNNLNNFISDYKYLQKAEAQTATAMARAEEQRFNYDQQKTIKEEKQQELEKKRLKLNSQKQDLDNKKFEEENLLSQTKNDEKRYQQLLAEAQKELRQIAAAANLVIREGAGVAVTKGEVVGTMGNSGYSTGDHLHFGVYKYDYNSFNNSSNWYYSNHVNPLDKLGSKTILWDTSCRYDASGSQNAGNGDWEWPMTNARITQSYGGNTCYNWMYGGKTHPALDMVAIGDISVKSVADGTAYFCRNCLGDGGNGVFIFHADSYMTLYWHLK